MDAGLRQRAEFLAGLRTHAEMTAASGEGDFAAAMANVLGQLQAVTRQLLRETEQPAGHAEGWTRA